jgi:hypothetical protein
MKNISIFTLLCLLSVSTFANSFYFAWSGVGVSTRFNYNIGSSYGAYYYRGVANGLGLGTYEFYQTFNTYYSREERSAVGQSVRMAVQYRFFSPMIVVQMEPTGQLQMYFTGGIGELQSGGEATQKKWSRPAWAPETYDSTIDLTNILSKYTVRMGFGFTQFALLGRNFHMFVNEDFGFMATPVADASGGQFAGLRTNPANILMPGYVSLRIGVGLITHSKDKRHPWRLYAGKEDPGF